jgi:hypothetical protein
LRKRGLGEGWIFANHRTAEQAHKRVQWQRRLEKEPPQLRPVVARRPMLDGEAFVMMRVVVFFDASQRIPTAGVDVTTALVAAAAATVATVVLLVMTQRVGLRG